MIDFVYLFSINAVEQKDILIGKDPSGLQTQVLECQKVVATPSITKPVWINLETFRLSFKRFVPFLLN